ncbi:protein kinase [Streptomyces sp. NPDC101166]|uniref:serine/threonine-protein kinase n=1 Tax=Streptomyces sp. NPDC101166 TaxID=3366120 RepID=UPI00380F550A
MSTGGQDRRVVDGRFELVERLGGGGMGVVWRARDLALHRDVAVKEVRPQDPALAAYDLEGARVLRERVLREARALARVHHPNVVTIHHIVDGGEGTCPWLVMELVTGGSLQDRLEQGTLTAVEAARLGRELLSALRAAHAVGIEHRDVKPANVLLRPDGRPVLTDFGIAAVREFTGLTATGAVIGSPDFMAPERVSGKEGGPAADLWSLGMLLYVAVEGHHPLRRASTLATLAAVLGEDVPAPRRAGPLTDVLTALLVRDPHRRPDADRVDHMLTTAAKAEPPRPSAPAAPPASAFGATPVSAAGAPPASAAGVPPASGLGASPASAFGATPVSGAGAPPASALGAAPVSAAGARPASGLGATPATAFGAPPASAAGVPPASALGATPASALGATPASAPGAPPAPVPGVTSYPLAPPTSGPLPAGAAPASWYPLAPSHPGAPWGGAGGRAVGPVARPARSRRGRAVGASAAVVGAALAGVLVYALLPFPDGRDDRTAGTDSSADAGAGRTASRAPKAAATPGAANADGTDDEGEVHLLTADGLRTTVAKLTDAMGGGKVTSLIVYDEYALADAPVQGRPKLYDRYTYRGGDVAVKDGPGGTVMNGDIPVDLAAFDWDALAALLDKAGRTLNVPRPVQRYLLLDPGSTVFDSDPKVGVYVSDDYGSAYLSADVHGKVIEKHPREDGGG